MGKVSSRLPSPCEQIQISTKERVTRRDLEKRASPVDRAHMKGSLVVLYCYFSLTLKIKLFNHSFIHPSIHPSMQELDLSINGISSK